MDIGELVSRLDRVLHEPARLGIAVELLSGSKTFAELKTAMSTSDGNLSVHGKKLEDAGYITIAKRFVGKVPQTTFTLTDQGRDSLTSYVEAIENIIIYGMPRHHDPLETDGAIRLYKQHGPEHILGLDNV